jgi:hypothetical protein
VLALISFSSIRASTFWYFADGNLVNITSAAGEIKDFFFVGAVFAGSSLAFNQEHALGFDASKSLEIGLRWLLTETLDPLFF